MMYIIFILFLVIIFLIIILSILNKNLHKNFEGFCVLDSSCKCDLKKLCIYQKSLDKCNNDLLNIGQICKVEMDSVLKQSYDINLPFLNNSQQLQEEINTNDSDAIKCTNEYRDLNDLNIYLTDINSKYKSMVNKLNNQLSDAMNINSDACP